MPSDDVLAFIVSHEIAHVAHKHWSLKSKKNNKESILNSVIAGVVGGSGADAARVYSEVCEMKYSRELELDADTAGIGYMQAAGFDPRGALAAFRIMRALGNSGLRSPYLSTHPIADERFENIRKILGLR